MVLVVDLQVFDIQGTILAFDSLSDLLVVVMNHDHNLGLTLALFVYFLLLHSQYQASEVVVRMLDLLVNNGQYVATLSYPVIRIFDYNQQKYAFGLHHMTLMNQTMKEWPK
jgi:hypothetical protein